MIKTIALCLLAPTTSLVEAFASTSLGQHRNGHLLFASSLDVGLSNIPNDEAGDLQVVEVDPGAINKSNGESAHGDSLPENMLKLPRHPHEAVNEILEETEHLIQSMHLHSKHVDGRANRMEKTQEKESSRGHNEIFANTYVDLGQVETVGFDYDYTLVTYTEELLELIYDMALKRLVHDRHYPLEMLDAGMVFDPFFSIRGK